MNLLLNIGLDVADKKNALSLRLVLASVAGWTLGTVLDSATHESDTERTAIVRVAIKDTLALRVFLDAVAHELRQDAIACVYEDGPDAGRGFLVGPRASEWGPFNPSYFLRLDGSRLA